MVQQFKATIIFCTLRQAPNTIKTIYQLDALVDAAAQSGEHTIIVNEPSADILLQVQKQRPNYQFSFRIS